MNTIDSNTLLPIGTPVIAGGHYGTVEKAEMVRAVPCGYVAAHTIRCTHRVEILGQWDAKHKNNGRREKLIPLKKPIIKRPNYAFIYIVQ